MKKQMRNQNASGHQRLARRLGEFEYSFELLGKLIRRSVSSWEEAFAVLGEWGQREIDEWDERLKGKTDPTERKKLEAFQKDGKATIQEARLMAEIYAKHMAPVEAQAAKARAAIAAEIEARLKISYGQTEFLLANDPQGFLFAFDISSY